MFFTNRIVMSATSSSSNSDKMSIEPPDAPAAEKVPEPKPPPPPPPRRVRLMAIRDDLPPMQERDKSSFMCGIICTSSAPPNEVAKASDNLTLAALQCKTFTLDQLDIAAYTGSGSASMQIGRALAYFTDTDDETKITKHYVLFQIWTQQTDELDALITSDVPIDTLVAQAQIVFMSAVIGHFSFLGATISYVRVVESTTAPSPLQKTRDIDWTHIEIEEVLTYPESIGVPGQVITHLYPCAEFHNRWPKPVPPIVAFKRPAPDALGNCRLSDRFDRDLLFLLLLHLQRNNDLPAPNVVDDYLYCFLRAPDLDAKKELARRVVNVETFRALNLVFAATAFN